MTRRPSAGGGQTGVDSESTPGIESDAIIEGAATPPAAPRRRRLLLGTAVALFYLLLACLAYWPVAPLDGSHIVGCACSDQAQEVWFLNWTAFAVLHGHNPLFSAYLLLPRGANLGLSTDMPLLGLLGLPVTATLGAVATYNVLLRLALAASGFSMYLLLRRYTSWWPAAVIGGLLYGFSPYMIGQGRGHLFLTFVPLPPLIIAIVEDWLVRRRRPPARSGLFLGVVAGLQYLISAEVLAITGVMVLTGLIVLAIRYWARLRAPVAALLRGSAVALAAFAVLAAYPIWMLADGPGHVRGSPHSVRLLAHYRDAVVGLIAPTANQLIDPSAWRTVGNPILIHDPAESGIYLGIPFLLVLAVLFIRCRRVGVVPVAAVAGLVAFILSLGSRLEINRHVRTVPLPFALLTHVPLLQGIEPSRFALFAQLGAAVILGVGLDRLRTEGVRSPAAATLPAGGPTPASPAARRRHAAPRRRWAPALVLLLAVASLLPLTPRLPYESVATQVPEVFGSTAVDTIPRGAIALTFPWDLRPNDDAMLWQAAAGMRFRILGGDVIVPSPSGQPENHPYPPGSPAIQRLFLQGTGRFRGPIPPDDATNRAALRRLIETQSVGVVFVLRTAPGALSIVRFTTRALGASPTTYGSIDVWVVKAGGP